MYVVLSPPPSTLLKYGHLSLVPENACQRCPAGAGAELYGKVLRVNAAKPMKHKLGAHTAGMLRTVVLA